MATRRYFRRRRVTSSLTDMQTRLTRLETAPKRAALNNGAVGYDQLETNVRTQLDAALAEAQNAAIQASKGILSYRMSEDPTTTRTISSYSLEFKTATIFTSTDNYYQIGSSVIISGLDPALDGEHLVTASFYSTDLTKFQIIVQSTATIPSTPAAPGAEVVLVPKEGDEWVDPTAGNETKSWDEVEDKWVKKDPVVEDGAIGITKDYNTTIRPNRITETISNASVVEGIVTVTATSHPFQEGDRLEVVLTVSGNALSKSPAIVFEVPDSNTFTYKIDDLTISVPTATAPTGAATAKYYLIDGDRWTDKDGVVWVWNSSTSSFEKKQDVNSTQKTQTYYSNDDPTTSVALASFVSSDGTVTITTTGQHYYIPGSVVEITSTSDPELNGEHVVSTVAGPVAATGNGTTFTFQLDIEDVPSSPFTGTTAVLKPRLGDKWVDTNDGNKQYVWANSADGDEELWQSETTQNPKNDELATMTVSRAVDPSTVVLTIDQRSLSKGVVRVRTTQPHGLKVGDRITVTGFPNNILNVTPGPGYVRGVLNTTEFTYIVPSGTRTLAQANVTATVEVRYFLAIGDVWIDTSNNRNEYSWADTNGDGVGDTWEDVKVTNPKGNEFASITYRTSASPSSITRTIDQRSLSKGVATVRTTAAHGFTAGDRLTITGFANTILNGSPVYVKQVLSNTQFTYEIPSGSRTIALGSGSATASYFLVKGDLWLDPATQLTYVYDGTQFVLHKDPQIQTAATDAATALSRANTAILDAGTALSTANGKNNVYYRTTNPAPVAPASGEVWVNGQANTAGDIWFRVNNTVITSTSAPGSTANTAGDIWRQVTQGGALIQQFVGRGGTQWSAVSANYSDRVIIAQWEGLGGTSWRQVAITDTVLTNLTAGKITSGIINAGLVSLSTNGLTGSGAGASVQITPQGFFAYDGSGNTTVSISSSNGAATFRGTVTASTVETSSSIFPRIAMTPTGFTIVNTNAETLMNFPTNSTVGVIGGFTVGPNVWNASDGLYFYTNSAFGGLALEAVGRRIRAATFIADNSVISPDIEATNIFFAGNSSLSVSTTTKRTVIGGAEERILCYTDDGVANITLGKSSSFTGESSVMGIRNASGTLVGSMFVTSSGARMGVTTNFIPDSDNTYNLGLTGNRWIRVFAVNTTISSSDARIKKDIETSSLGLSFIESLRPVSYKFVVGGKELVYDENGEPVIEGYDKHGQAIFKYKDVPGKRRHWGFIAQEVKQAIDESGVEDFAGWSIADVNDPESTQSLSYEQFISPVVKAIQELSAEVKSLKTRIQEVENR